MDLIAGRACYSCNGASTNEECNSQPVQICPMDADACENEVRENNGMKQIFKRCKQSLACENNFIQVSLGLLCYAKISLCLVSIRDWRI